MKMDTQKKENKNQLDNKQKEEDDVDDDTN